MKKLFLSFLMTAFLSGCASEYGDVATLSVEFLRPTKWNGKIIPPRQSCRAEGGKGSTPPLYVTGIPEETNLLILEIDDLDMPGLDENGGLGSIGFYHNGDFSASLLPVDGETHVLPPYAFKEKSNRVNPANPYAYMPPCIEKNHHMYVATVKAVKRTGSFDRQETIILGEGFIRLGRY